MEWMSLINEGNEWKISIYYSMNELNGWLNKWINWMNEWDGWTSRVKEMIQ